MTAGATMRAVEAQFRCETGDGIAIWIGDRNGLQEAWVWLPRAEVTRPNPQGRGKPEIFHIPEWLVDDKKLDGFDVDDARPQQEDLF